MQDWYAKVSFQTEYPLFKYGAIRVVTSDLHTDIAVTSVFMSLPVCI